MNIPITRRAAAGPRGPSHVPVRADGRRSRLKRLSLVVVATGVAFGAVAGSASAFIVSTPGLAPPAGANGTIIIHYGTHNYPCYYHDLCVFRGGRFEAYYKCQTVWNSTTAVGWALNNQSPAGQAHFYGYLQGPGFLDEVLDPKKFAYVSWQRVTSFRTCYS